MADKVKHWGFMSTCTVDDPTEYYTTVDNDEIIEFIDVQGIQRSINSITIFTVDSDLLINIKDGYCITIKNGSSLSLDYLQMKSMQIIGNAGIKVKYYALYY